MEIPSEVAQPVCVYVCVCYVWGGRCTRVVTCVCAVCTRVCAVCWDVGVLACARVGTVGGTVGVPMM